MIRCAEPSQLHPLPVLNLLGIRISPLDGHLAVGVGVDEHVEGAVAVELGEECDARGDLAEDGGDFGLDFLLGLFGSHGGGGGGGGGVFLIGGFGGRGGLGL